MESTPFRPTFNAYYLAIAHVVAQRASCEKRKVGCILVSSQNRIIGTGYNGTLPGMPECSFSLDKGCYNLSRQTCLMQHAEVNAIEAVANKSAILGATAYVTTLPCYPCLFSLINAGVKTVYFPESNYWDVGLERLQDKVALIRLTPDEIKAAMETVLLSADSIENHLHPDNK